MNMNLADHFNELKAEGLSPEREERLLAELRDERRHEVEAGEGPAADPHPFYASGDLAALQDAPSPSVSYTAGIR